MSWYLPQEELYKILEKFGSDIISQEPNNNKKILGDISSNWLENDQQIEHLKKRLNHKSVWWDPAGMLFVHSINGPQYMGSLLDVLVEKMSESSIPESASRLAAGVLWSVALKVRESQNKFVVPIVLYAQWLDSRLVLTAVVHGVNFDDEVLGMIASFYSRGGGVLDVEWNEEQKRLSLTRILIADDDLNDSVLTLFERSSNNSVPEVENTIGIASFDAQMTSPEWEEADRKFVSQMSLAISKTLEEEPRKNFSVQEFADFWQKNIVQGRDYSVDELLKIEESVSAFTASQPWKDSISKNEAKGKFDEWLRQEIKNHPDLATTFSFRFTNQDPGGADILRENEILRRKTLHLERKVEELRSKLILGRPVSVETYTIKTAVSDGADQDLREEIERLTKTMEKKEADSENGFMDMMKRFAQREDEYHRLRQKSRTQEAEINEMKKGFVELEGQLKSTISRNQQMGSVTKSIQSKYRVSEEKYRAQIRDLSLKLNEKPVSNAKATQKQEEINGSQVQSLTKQNQQLQQVIKELNGKITKFENAKANDKPNNESTTKVASLSKRLADSAEEIKRLKKIADELKRKETMAKVEVSKLQSELNAFKKKAA